MLSPSRHILTGLVGFYYPFGNTRSRNVFEITNSQMDPSKERIVTKILFLGCGDVRNALQATLPNQNGDFQSLHIHLNDVNSSIMARNILVFKIISSSDFNPNVQEDLSFLWDVWYNTEWPESTRKKFQEATKSLLDGSLPENVVFAKSSQLQNVRKIWLQWLSDSSKKQSDANILINEMQNQRSSLMVLCWNNMMREELAVTGSAISKAVESLSSQFQNAILAEDIDDDSKKKKIGLEIRRYFKSGDCRLLEIKSKTVCFNPTMLQQSTSKRWLVPSSNSPFEGYVPLTKEELDTSTKDGILIRSCQKMLKQLVSSYKSRMEDVKLFFHLGDALEFCYTETNDIFDIIDCSNLGDHIGLANLINAASRRLSDSPGSTLITESMNWNTLASSIIQYIEETLCTSLSMIPSTYGLRLFIKNPGLLCWQKAPPLQNVNLQSSPTLTRWLQQLARKCFTVIKEPVKKGTRESLETCGMKTYTPLTFNYIVDSMIQRVGGDKWFIDARNHLGIPSTFHLHQKTMEAWKNGRPVVNLSIIINLRTQNNPFERLAADTAKDEIAKLEHRMGTPIIRLLLVPSKCLMNFDAKEGDALCRDLLCGFSSPDAHYVDNLKLELTKSSNGELETLSMSFPMIPDHGLEKTHVACVLDLISGMPLFYTSFLTRLRIEEFSLPYPHPTGHQLPLVRASSQMVADSCVETDSQYTLKISIEGSQNISGLKVDTDQQKPCESAHEIVLSLSQPNNLKPLTLSFPYPFLVDNIRATLHRQDRFIDLILTKAVMEPWPCEFQVMENSKLIVERLKPWEENSSLASRLSTQFANLLKNPSQSNSVLFKVCKIFETLFTQAVSHGQEYFVVKRLKPANLLEGDDWLLRVHMPIRTSPTRSAIMMITAIDSQLYLKLIAAGKPNSQKAEANFSRIFHQAPSETISSFKLILIGPEEAQLLRYVLRFNSTKIVPSDWQKENVPLGENSPWLATFISPFCDEFQLRSNPTGVMNSSSTTSAAETVKMNASCASCQIIPANPKRCSRCRSIVYCSVECQRAHWTQHKIVCSQKLPFLLFIYPSGITCHRVVGTENLFGLLRRCLSIRTLLSTWFELENKFTQNSFRSHVLLFSDLQALLLKPQGNISPVDYQFTFRPPSINQESSTSSSASPLSAKESLVPASFAASRLNRNSFRLLSKLLDIFSLSRYLDLFLWNVDMAMFTTLNHQDLIASGSINSAARRTMLNSV